MSYPNFPKPKTPPEQAEFLVNLIHFHLFRRLHPDPSLKGRSTLP